MKSPHVWDSMDRMTFEWITHIFISISQTPVSINQPHDTHLYIYIYIYKPSEDAVNYC